MIGHKKSLSEWQCLSEFKMGRGSPIPPMPAEPAPRQCPPEPAQVPAPPERPHMPDFPEGQPEPASTSLLFGGGVVWLQP